MKIDQLRQMNDEELSAKLTELREEKANLRIQQAVTTMENPMRMKKVRRTIARIKTLRNERESAEEKNNE